MSVSALEGGGPKKRSIFDEISRAFNKLSCCLNRRRDEEVKLCRAIPNQTIP